MNRESLTKLRHDRRLLHRRGWITPKEREKALAGLPDVADKATTLGEAAEGDEASGSDSEPASTAG